MRAALAEEFGGIDGVRLGERPDPVPAAGQALAPVAARHARGKIVLHIGQ